MKILKILKFLLLLVVLLAGLVFAEIKFGFLPNQYRRTIDDSMGEIFGTNPENINQIISSPNLDINLDQSTLTTFKEKGTEISGQVKGVFSKVIEPSSEEKPLHDRAFEYGRYLYCREVVKNYEKQSSDSPEEN